MITLLAQLDISLESWLLPWHVFYLKGTLCSILVGVTCGVLGCFVVLRRMALIGDALSHAVLPGVVLTFIVTGDTQPLPLLAGAMGAGLLASVLINLVSRHSRTKEDSSIGVVFTAMFAAGILLTNSLPKGTHFDLKCFLFGDALQVNTADLTMMAVISGCVLALITLLYHRFKLVSFDPLVAAAMGVSVGFFHYLLMGMLSATVVAGLKSTGVVLVVAMIITPASAAYQLTNRFAVMLWLSALFGAVSAALGMSVAFIFNASTGPAMVLVATAIFALAMFFSPSHGILFDRLRRWRLARHVRGEDVLKALHRLGPLQPADHIAALNQRLKWKPAQLTRTLARLRREGLITPTTAAETALTPEGTQHAQAMVRAHRLWETYLTDRAGVDPKHVHEEAERLEHAHELTEDLDEMLGHPDTDPHGSTIPR
ncbi:MAG: iron chelate uptake ABC transporter family permease subunit [Algisphaera sp.]